MSWSRPPQDPDPGDAQIEVEVEIDPEHAWRCRMLEQAGFTAFQAFRLSIGGADWHDAKKLLDSGCAPERIIEILT